MVNSRQGIGHFTRAHKRQLGVASFAKQLGQKTRPVIRRATLTQLANRHLLVPQKVRAGITVLARSALPTRLREALRRARKECRPV